MGYDEYVTAQRQDIQSRNVMPPQNSPGRLSQSGQKHSPERSSPLRHTASNASTASSAFSSASSNPFMPSRTSTMSSSASSAYENFGVGHKRGISDVSPTRSPDGKDLGRHGFTAAGGYKSVRESLKPLPQAPGPSAHAGLAKSYLDQPHGKTFTEPSKYTYDGPAYSPKTDRLQLGQTTNSSFLGRGGSVTPMTSTSRRVEQQNVHTSPTGSPFISPDFKDLKGSSTSHLRTLSKFAQTDSSDDVSISLSNPSVAGLSGRKQLKRTGSTRPNRGTGSSNMARSSAWAENNWMEKQRQFLQAYEYLCHIGEAKEWIEDIIHQQLPPIVQLEEALRDGVTLAEIVQAFYPDQNIRIFRHQKLQFRHSDNIALFFRFLADMELPELFRFELIDLYEKKNIPKVIYCIHALSWLLFRKGLVDFRIGNLVGQLHFEHHELEEMQKGLDKAGVNMPSFAAMGANFGAEIEPEPEPVESEEDRIRRELEERMHVIIDLQSQIRGASVRMGLGDKMQGLWDAEEMLLNLQARIRGNWIREIAQYRQDMRLCAINVQSAARGFLQRKQQHDRNLFWRSRGRDVLLLQSLVRAKATRDATQQIKASVQKEQNGVKSLQAAIRGCLARKRVDDQWAETAEMSASVDRLQALMRGMLCRRRLEDQKARLATANSNVVKLQAAARATAQRQRMIWQAETLQRFEVDWRALQSISRGALCRQRQQDLRRSLSRQAENIKSFQAVSRGCEARKEFSRTQQSLRQMEPTFTSLQAAARKHLYRSQYIQDQKFLHMQSPQITSLQGLIRGTLTRASRAALIEEISTNEGEIIQLQALSRAMVLRTMVESLLRELEDEEAMIAELQAAIRGRLVRAKFAEKQRFFKANMEKVVKVQSFVRGRLQGEAYKSLTSGNNPPVGTVKSFVHLLNDSDFDFDEEVEFERLRKTVVQHVRQNEMADQYISQLDIKIALLVKNKITLDEVVKHQKHFGTAAGSLLSNGELASKDPFDLKALNKNSRRKLEHYQELFFILQTQPQYLARLFRNIREQATGEKECDRVKHLVMGLFGYAQKRREEYYLIKLMTRSMKEEIDNCSSVQDYLRGNFFWVKLFGAYIKSPRDRKFMRDILGPLVKENIIENQELDLESDPMQIYLSAIENEQLRTGQMSQRSPDIPREAAIRDPETKRTFITHLQDLRDLADQFFLALEDQLHKMPFGVRYLAQQMYQMLTAKFPHDEPGHILQIVGHWVWKKYLHPALSEPDKFGVIDRGLGLGHKRNIGEVSKVLGQVAAGRLFGGENVFLQPLNSYVGESIERLGDTWGHCKGILPKLCGNMLNDTVIDVPSVEATFDIDEFNDLYSKTKPTLYVKMADIFSIHHLVAGDTSAICSNRDDILREVIGELGSVKNNESELINVSGSEICLTLNPKLHESEGKNSQLGQSTPFTKHYNRS